jgi:hypothetical protein
MRVDRFPRPVRRATRRNGRARVVALQVLALAFVAVLILLTLNRRNVNAGLNTPVRFDDFVFTVLSSRKAAPDEWIGLGPSPGNVKYVVTMRIDNRAKRVPFRFKDAAPLLIDGRGKEYPTDVASMRAREATSGRGNTTAGSIPAGTSVVKDLVFEVPATVERPTLTLMQGGRVGEFLETSLFGRKRFVLP